MNPLPAHHPTLRISPSIPRHQPKFSLPLSKIPAPLPPVRQALRPIAPKGGAQHTMPILRRPKPLPNVQKAPRALDLLRFSLAEGADALPALFTAGIFVTLMLKSSEIPILWPMGNLERFVVFVQRFPGVFAVALSLLWLSHLVYSGLFLLNRRPTFGQKLLGVTLRSTKGKNLEFKHWLWREIFLPFSALSLGAGFLWCLIDERGRTWHDVLAETEIIAI